MLNNLTIEELINYSLRCAGYEDEIQLISV